MSEVLPEGWAAATIADITEIHDSRRVPLNQAERATRQGPYAYYGANGLVDSIDRYLFEGDHILLAEDGGYFDDPFRPNAYAVTGKFWVNNHAHILRARQGVDQTFILHALNATNLMPFVSGTTRLKLTQADTRRIPIPLPPLAEQRRIVARIEALFARTRRARADLLRIAPLAEHVRAAATERSFQPDDRTRWRTESLGDIADIKSGITLGKKYPPDATLVERPYLRVANVQRGYLNLATIKFVRLSASEADRLALRPGDVLMNEGGDRDKLGRGWVWEGQVTNCIHQNHVFRLRLRGATITPYYLSRYANQFGARYFLDEGKQTTNLASISMSKVAALPIPVPPPGVAAHIDSHLSRVESSARTMAFESVRALALLDRLEQSILAKAFRGELVPQDPNDEPAESQLARLRGGQLPARGGRARNQRASV